MGDFLSPAAGILPHGPIGPFIPRQGQGIDRNNAEKYLPRMPVDPWDNDYMYANPGQHGEFDVYTYGADGEEGGEDVNADIGNWNLDD